MQPQPQQSQQLTAFKRELLDGFRCSKHARNGRVRSITILLPPPFTELRWSERPGVELKALQIQKGSKSFKNEQPEPVNSCCLTLVSSRRNVDLEFESEAERDKFKRGLRMLVEQCSGSRQRRRRRAS